MKKRISINNGNAVPQSFITKNKQRVKQYVDTIYLNNGDEFELELFNPTQDKVLAKIELNGESIGNGIILRPGERVFLERYLNEPKKFKYETYFVDNNNDSVESAIKKNGDVMVSFYDELITNPTYLYNPTSFTTLNYTGNYNGTDTVTPTFNGTNIVNYNSTLSFSSPEVRGASLNFTPKRYKETGRVEKGGNSSQKFVYDSTQFSTTKIATNWWKILPMSEKVKTIDEVQTFYCSSCGTKRKKESHRYCPHCGNKY